MPDPYPRKCMVLTSQQLVGLMEYTADLQLAVEYRMMAQRTAEALRELLDCDLPTVSLATGSYQDPVQEICSPAANEWRKTSNIGYELRHENPVYMARLRKQLDGPGQATDFVDRGEFEQTRSYNEVWRKVGIRQVLNYMNPGRYGFDLVAARSSSKPFEESDAMILTMIARNLEAATTRLLRANRGLLPVGDELREVMTFDWFICDTQGRTLRTDSTASQSMKTCLGSEAAVDHLPERWLNDLTRRAAGGPAGTQYYVRDGKQLSVHIAPIHGVPDEFSVGFVTRIAPQAAHDPLSSTTLQRFGLTHREAEVTRWLAEGKTNPEIGIILGISALTAKKHVENVLHKLGVETRTAAVRRVMEA